MARSRPRVGLVLGAGGVVGHAYHAGALAGLQQGLGWDARHADVVVGTSAGAVVAAGLRAGLEPRSLLERVTIAPGDAVGRAMGPAGQPVELGPGARRLAGVRPASPGMALRALLRPWEARYGLVLAGVLPRGQTGADGIAERVRAMHDRTWPDRALWVTAVRLRDGARVVFGRKGAPAVDVGTAVQASTAVPALFAPVEVGGEHHVDGGAHSPTNADVLAGCCLDAVVVVAPMSASRGAIRPGRAGVIRLAHRMTLEREVRALRRTGTTVVTLQPSAEDVDALGTNAMDASRRGAVAEQAAATTRRRLAGGLAEVLAPLLIDGTGPP